MRRLQPATRFSLSISFLEFSELFLCFFENFKSLPRLKSQKINLRGRRECFLGTRWGVAFLFFFILSSGMSVFHVEASDKTGGIGVILEVLPDKKIHRIRAVFQGSPAARAKIQAGEEILAVDGASVSSMSFEELGSRVMGEPGSAVTLTLRSQGSSVSREVRLVRVSSHKVSPLIQGQGGTTSSPRRAILSDEERQKIKEVIGRLKTPQENQKMEQLLLNFRDGKISKDEFFIRLKQDFPSS